MMRWLKSLKIEGQFHRHHTIQVHTNSTQWSYRAILLLNMKNRCMKKALDRVTQECQHIMELLTGHELEMMECHRLDPVMQLVSLAVRTLVNCLIVENLSLLMVQADDSSHIWLKLNQIEHTDSHISLLENAQILQIRIELIQPHSINRLQDLRIRMKESRYPLTILNVTKNEILTASNLHTIKAVNQDQTVATQGIKCNSTKFPIITQNNRSQDAKTGLIISPVKAWAQTLGRSIHPFVAIQTLKIITECSCPRLVQTIQLSLLK